MQLEHSFTVPVGIDDAWRVLLDLELIAPCMPGAAIDSIDGDDFTGTVKVKLGPIGLTYKGKASFIEKDEAAHRAVIDARGRDSRGNGTANAKVTATLTESSGSTKVDVITDLDITGKPAQFGRGVMADVGNKLIGEFADCLAGKLTDGATTSASDAPAPEPSAPPELAAVGSDGADAGAKPKARPRKTTASATKSPPAKATKTVKATKATAKAPAKTAAKSTAKTTTKATAKAPAKTTANATVPERGDGHLPEPAVAPPVAQPTPRARPAAADVEPIDLIESAGPAVLKRLAPVILLVILALLALRRRRQH